MKLFSETTVANDLKIYMKAELRNIFDKLKPGDVLEWYLDNGEVIVRKKEENRDDR